MMFCVHLGWLRGSAAPHPHFGALALDRAASRGRTVATQQRRHVAPPPTHRVFPEMSQSPLLILPRPNSKRTGTGDSATCPERALSMFSDQQEWRSHSLQMLLCDSLGNACNVWECLAHSQDSSTRAVILILATIGCSR